MNKLEENTKENFEGNVSDGGFFEEEARPEDKAENDEESIRKAVLKIKKKYGKNAILKGTSYQEGATARERNSEIGGHKA